MKTSSIKKNILHIGIVLLISILFLPGLDHLAYTQTENEKWKVLEEVLMKFAPAARYEVLPVQPGTKGEEDVQYLYEAFGRDDEKVGIILNIAGEDVFKDDYVWLVFSADGKTLTYAGVYNAQGQMTGEIPSTFFQDIYNVRMPIVMDKDIENLNVAEPVLKDLKDGVFRRHMETTDAQNYKDYVEIHVKNGRIVFVAWDAVSTKDDEENRRQASISGELKKEKDELEWARQAYLMQQKLVEVQDPDLIQMSSNGTTDLVPGVTTNIDLFDALVRGCIDDSRLGNVVDPLYPEEENGVSQSNDIPYVSEVRKNTDFASAGEDGVILDSAESENYLYGFSRESIQTIVTTPNECQWYNQAHSLLDALNRGYVFLQSVLDQ